MIPRHKQNGRMVGHPDQHVYPDVAFIDGRLIGRQISVYDEQVGMRLHRIPHKPLQTLGRIGKVVIFLQVYVTQMCANEIHSKYAPFQRCRDLNPIFGMFMVYF